MLPTAINPIDVPIAAPAAKVIAGWLGEEGLSGYLDKKLVSQAALDAEQNFMPTGDITDPSTLAWGKDPTIRGAVIAGARVLGTMAPVIAASLLSKNPTIAAERLVDSWPVVMGSDLLPKQLMPNGPRKCLMAGRGWKPRRRFFRNTNQKA